MAQNTLNRPAPAPSVTPGADRLIVDPGLLRGDGPVGLITNYTGVRRDLRPIATGLLESGVRLTALFGPEHGLQGTAQAGYTEDADHDPESGLPLFDTYRRTPAEQDQQIEASGVATLMFDLQDIGARFYTYVWTMYDLMLAAGRTGCRFVVLDRPNPLTGLAAGGPRLEPGHESFVGRVSIPLRHGLTVGELADQLNRTAVLDQLGRPVDLEVITADGWQRGQWHDETGLVWIPPSPNIPTLDTAICYVGTGLFEGTNLSEGRGTTRPFETLGAPFCDARLAAAVTERGLPGVLVRPTSFVPTFHKYAGEVCHGVALHVVDRAAFDPIRTSCVIMEVAGELYPEFGQREGAGTGVDNPGGTGHALDKLWGSAELRRRITAREPLEPLATPPAHPSTWIADPALLRY
jgi:uncharacterized protein YbbC (DUF1343 family)